MPKDKLTDYDSTASNNTDVGGISVAEGMLPSGVNNAIREQMSHLADFAAGTSGVDVLKLQDDTDTNSIKLQAPSSVTTTTTFTMPDGDGSADQVLKTDGSGQLGWVAQTAVAANPNLIINGGMTVSQRGTSFTSQTGVAYHIDRFETQAHNVGTAQYKAEQSTEAPDGFYYSLKYSCTTADTSQDANNQFYIQQQIEAQNIYHLKFYEASPDSVTVSFYVRSNTTGSYGMTLKLSDNNSSDVSTDTRIYPTTFSISSADTWERITKTITLDSSTSETRPTGNNMGMSLVIWLAAGSNRQGATANAWAGNGNATTTVDADDFLGSTSNNFHLTGVKLEAGSTATDFVHRSYGEELALCQRYYQAFKTGRVNTSLVSIASSTSQAIINMPLQVEPRALASYDGSLASGTFTKTGTVAVNAFPSNGDNVTSIPFWVCNSTEITVGLTTSATLVQYNGYVTRIGATTGETVFTLDVEL